MPELVNHVSWIDHPYICSSQIKLCRILLKYVAPG